jgi:capsular polysaccharide biosynthesis protein
MELRRYLAIITRRSLLVVLTTLVGALAAWFTAPTSTTYRAEATIYVGARQFLEPSSSGLSADTLAGLERVINTFSIMADSEPIASEALRRTGIERSASTVVARTAATPIPSTQLLRITVADTDPSVAQSLANGLADSLAEAVQEFEPTAEAAEGSLPALPAYVFERARFPAAPEPTGTLRRIVLGALFGFLVGVAVAFLLEYLDLTIKGPEDAEHRTDLPVLGVIPVYQRPPDGDLRRA